MKLICEVSKPDADVTWYKGDEELPEGGRYDQIVDGKRRILLIQDLKMSDAGEYNCRLSPSVKTSGNLKINGAGRNGDFTTLFSFHPRFVKTSDLFLRSRTGRRVHLQTSQPGGGRGREGGVHLLRFQGNL